MAFNDTKQFINAVVQHQDARGISKNEILADKVALQSRNKSERLKPRKQSRTGYGGGGELEESSASGGGGIASPLIEIKINLDQDNTEKHREYYPVKQIELGDGIHQVSVYEVKTLHMTDANGAEVDIKFEPSNDDYLPVGA